MDGVDLQLRAARNRRAVEHPPLPDQPRLRNWDTNSSRVIRPDVLQHGGGVAAPGRMSGNHSRSRRSADHDRSMSASCRGRCVGVDAVVVRLVELRLVHDVVWTQELQERAVVQSRPAGRGRHPAGVASTWPTSGATDVLLKEVDPATNAVLKEHAASAGRRSSEAEAGTPTPSSP